MSDQTPGSLTPAPPPSGGLPRWVVPALLGSAGVIVALLMVVIVLLVGGGEDGDSDTAAEASKSAKPEMFDVYGDITLSGYGDIFVSGSSCVGDGGYDDLQSGAQVVVRDSTGKTLAAADLEEGEKQSSIACLFAFHVEDVPSGAGPYSIEVSHRGEITFSEEDAENKLHYTLG